jgi:hypothetical protein
MENRPVSSGQKKGSYFVVEICTMSVCTFGVDPHDNCVLEVDYANLDNHWCDAEVALSQLCMDLERQPIRRCMMYRNVLSLVQMNFISSTAQSGLEYLKGLLLEVGLGLSEWFRTNNICDIKLRQYVRKHSLDIQKLFPVDLFS